MFPRSLIILMHVHKHNARTRTRLSSIFHKQLKTRTRDAHATHTRAHSHIFSETKGRADCNIFLHFKKVASVKMINEGSWGRACILTLDCTGASGRTLVSDGFSAALRLPLLLGRSRHANCMPQQWLAMRNYDRGNKTSSTQQACEGVRPDITRVGWWCCVPYTGVGW